MSDILAMRRITVSHPRLFFRYQAVVMRMKMGHLHA